MRSFNIFKMSKPEKTVNIYEGYQSKVDLYYDRHIKSTIWHRVDDTHPKMFNGFIGRETLPKNDLNSYVLANKKFGGWGGVFYPHDGVNFAKLYRDPKQTFLFTSLNLNTKISIPAWLTASPYGNIGALATRTLEHEVVVIGDVAKPFVFLATNEFDRLISGKEVENLLANKDNDYPSSYTIGDITGPEAVLAWLIKNNAIHATTWVVASKLAPISPVIIETAKKTGSQVILEMLEKELGATNTSYASPQPKN